MRGCWVSLGKGYMSFLGLAIGSHNYKHRSRTMFMQLECRRLVGLRVLSLGLQYSMPQALSRTYIPP